MWVRKGFVFTDSLKGAFGVLVVSFCSLLDRSALLRAASVHDYNFIPRPFIENTAYLHSVELVLEYDYSSTKYLISSAHNKLLHPPLQKDERFPQRAGKIVPLTGQSASAPNGPEWEWRAVPRGSLETG